MKKYVYIVFTIAFFTILFFILLSNRQDQYTNDVLVVQKETELCFTKFGPKQESGFYDKFTLRLILSGEGGSVAVGELSTMPAGKDALSGIFEGVVGPVDVYTMTRTADLWWNVKGEDERNKQQLSIIFGEGIASIGFGEMVDRGDGVYVYKDISAVDYSMQLNDTSCTDLNERESVEKYLLSNIKTLSPISPVLGGTWYVVSIDFDLEKNAGTVVYEDGHIQEKRVFTYEIDGESEITKFIIQ